MVFQVSGARHFDLRGGFKHSDNYPMVYFQIITSSLSLKSGYMRGMGAKCKCEIQILIPPLPLPDPIGKITQFEIGA